MTEQQAIKDLKFIRDAYKNLSENGSNRYRAVGKDIDCSVEIKTNADLHGHYTEALEMAIKAMEKLIPKEPIEFEDKYYGCSACNNMLMYKRIKYSTELTPKADGLP